MLRTTLHLQNAGRRWNFSSSNIAGSVWGWTVKQKLSQQIQVFVSNLAFAPGWTSNEYHALRKCRPLAVIFKRHHN
jgi:hypothetical protein